MNRVIMILFLLLIWCGFNNSFNVEMILFGLVISSLCHFIVIPPHKKNFYHIRLVPLLSVITLILFELVRSGIEVAIEVIRLKPRSQPKLIEVPLACDNDIEILLLANLLSLTPGTLAINTTQDNTMLTVHLMFGQNQNQMEDFIKNKLEPKIIKVFNQC